MTPDKPPSDGLTRQEVWTLLENNNKWWRDALEASERHWREGHARIGNALDRNTQAMNDGFGSVRDAMTSHAREDELVARRVTVIETERAVEKRTTTQRGAIAGSIAAGLVLTLVESLKKAFGHP